jgi:hypothetical protein
MPVNVGQHLKAKCNRIVDHLFCGKAEESTIIAFLTTSSAINGTIGPSRSAGDD